VTVYWLDPFLEATTQGNGTTDTTTKNGTYAAPFSLSQFWSTTSTTFGTVNGVTLADGDELRMKGLPFSTLFESKGNVHCPSNQSANYVSLQPVTGNSSFDATISATKSSTFALQSSDISAYLTNHSHPFFMAARYNSTSSALYVCSANFLVAIVAIQLGHNSSSDTGIELFRLKDTYANLQDFAGNYNYAFAMANKVKISAGWTSTTEQAGYSIYEGSSSSSYRYMNINGNTNSKTEFDCERLICNYSPRTSGGNNNNVQAYMHYSSARAVVTNHVFPMFVSSTGRSDYYYGVRYPGDTGVYPFISGSGDSSSDGLYLNFENLSSATTLSTSFKNIATTGNLLLNNGNSKHNIKIGSLYCRAYSGANDNDGLNRCFRHYNLSGGRKGTYTFLQNSKYYFYRGYDTDPEDNVLQPYPAQTESVTYETGLVRPGIAPLDNMSPSLTGYGPLSAGITSSQPMFLATREVSANNTWFTSKLDSVGTNPIEYCSLGKLICNSNDYRNTAHNIGTDNSTVLAADSIPKFKIWSAEHNDFDSNPISIIGNPYYTGSSTVYGALVYNDVVNNTSVLVVQASGTATGDAYVWLPMELPVPTYTAGSDNLRVTVSAAYADGGSNNTAGTLQIKAYHRDTTQTENFRYYLTPTSIAAGGDPTSTTTVTRTLPNVPTTGQKNITNVIVNLGFNIYTSAVIRKFYITNVAIETY